MNRRRLDPQSRRELHEVIEQTRAAGKTVVITTHYIEEAQQLCDRLAVIDHGQIIASGTPAELIAAAKSPPHIEFTTTAAPESGEFAGAAARQLGESERGIGHAADQSAGADDYRSGESAAI